MNPKAEPTPQAEEMYYPAGGEQSKVYRITFTVWVLTFLVVISAGLLNYIGTFLKAKWQ